MSRLGERISYERLPVGQDLYLRCPREIDCLEVMFHDFNGTRNGYAVLRPNDVMGLGAFPGEDIRLVTIEHGKDEAEDKGIPLSRWTTPIVGR